MFIQISKLIPIELKDSKDIFKQIRIEEKNNKWICLCTNNYLENNTWRITQPYIQIVRESDTEKYIEFGKHLIQIEKIFRVDLNQKFIHIDILANDKCRITYSNFINSLKEIEYIEFKQCNI